MLTLGFALAEFRVRRASLAVGLGLGRLALGFGIALGVSELLGLTGIARSYARVADAADLVQEMLLQIWKGLPRFEGRSSEATWVSRSNTLASS